MRASDMMQIEELIADYFKGLHYADIGLLGELFDEQAQLQAPGIRRSRSEWLSLVASRPVPAERGDPFVYRLDSIDLAGEQAVARIYCPLLDHQYVDFLSLLKEQGRWRIVNKMYADKP